MWSFPYILSRYHKRVMLLSLALVKEIDFPDCLDTISKIMQGIYKHVMSLARRFPKMIKQWNAATYVLF